MHENPRLGVAGVCLVFLLSACGGSGGSGTKEQPDFVLPQAVTLSIPATVEAGTGTAFSTDIPAVAPGVLFSWDLGDGTLSTQARPVHTYAIPGDFTVKLTVRDAGGRQLSAQTRVQAGYYARLQGLRCSGTGTAGWCRQLPLPWKPWMHDLQFVDASTAWLAGDDGLLLHSRDAGATWTEKRLPGSPGLRQILFSKAGPGTRQGWLLSTEGVWRTQDAGETWTQGAPVPVDFPTRLAAAGQSQLLVWGSQPGSPPAISEDHGQTWRVLNKDIRHVEADGTLWGLPATPLGAFFQLYPGVPFMKSLDAGRSFVAEAGWPADGVVDWMDVADDGSVWALSSRWVAAEYGTRRTFQWLQRSASTGVWSPSALPVDGTSCNPTRLLQSASGTWAQGLCDRLQLWHQDNPAAGWVQRDYPAGVRVTNSGLVDGQTAYVQVNSNGWPYVSVDAGRSWHIADPAQALPDGNFVETVLRSAGGLLLRSSTHRPASPHRLPKSWYRSRDGGQSWNSIWSAPGHSDNFAEIWFGNARRGLAVTMTGAVLASDDGGRNWRTLDPANLPIPNESQTTRPGRKGLSSLQSSPDGITLWALAGGKLVLSPDMGRTWQTHAPQPASTLPGGITDLRWLDGQRVYAVSTECSFGSSPHYPTPIRCTSSLYRSDDAALTWRVVNNGVSACQRLYLSSNNQGVCLDRESSSYTTDGGVSWTVASGAKPPYEDVLRVSRSSTGTLWSLSSSALLRSDDEGRSWRTVALPTRPTVLGEESGSRVAALHDIVLAGPNRVWVVGEQGLVLSSEDGGLSWTRQTSAVQSHLTTAFALDEHTLWLGADNSILATATGGR